jgi:hypothetical protein
MIKKWIKIFVELSFLAIILSVLIHYAGNIIFIFYEGEVVIFETDKTILSLEFFFDILAITYVTYRIIKISKLHE